MSGFSLSYSKPQLRLYPVNITHKLRNTKKVAVRAEPEGEPKVPVQSQPSEAKPLDQPAASGTSVSGLKPGQGTAIVTGGISLILGIAYIALTVLLDTRGGELLPPPPEAFMQ